MVKCRRNRAEVEVSYSTFHAALWAVSAERVPPDTKRVDDAISSMHEDSMHEDVRPKGVIGLSHLGFRCFCSIRSVGFLSKAGAPRATLHV